MGHCGDSMGTLRGHHGDTFETPRGDTGDMLGSYTPCTPSYGVHRKNRDATVRGQWGSRKDMEGTAWRHPGDTMGTVREQ